MCMFPAVIIAQNPDLVPIRSAVTDSIAIHVAAEKADTGRWMPGYRDLSRYDTPGYCMALMQNIQKATLRRGEMDTVEVGSPEHGYIPVTREIGRRCANLLSIDATPPQEFYNFMSLLIAIDDSVRFDSLMVRQLSVAADEEERAWILSDAATLSIVTRPIARGIMSRVFQQMDSIGPSVPDQWMSALAARHKWIWEEYDTVAMWNNEKNPIVQRWRSFPKDKQFAPAFRITLDSLEHAYYQRDLELPKIARQYMEQVFREYQSGVAPFLISNIINGAEYQATYSRREIFPFHKGMWFPDTAGAGFMNSGKVTLVYKISRVHSHSIKQGRLDPMLARLRRIKQRYGDKVDVVLHVPTEGYIWSSPPLSFISEAKALQWLFFEHLNLPFTLFVDETPIAKRHDGRLLRGESPNNVVADASFLAKSNGFSLIDKNNRLILFFDSPSEARLRAYVARALQEEWETPNSSSIRSSTK